MKSTPRYKTSKRAREDEEEEEVEVVTGKKEGHEACEEEEGDDDLMNTDNKNLFIVQEREEETAQKAPLTAFNSMRILSSTQLKEGSVLRRGRLQYAAQTTAKREKTHLTGSNSKRFQRTTQTAVNKNNSTLKQIQFKQKWENETPEHNNNHIHNNNNNNSNNQTTTTKDTPGIELRRGANETCSSSLKGKDLPSAGRFRRRRRDGDGNTSEPQTEDKMPPSTEAAVRRRRRRRQLEAQLVGDYNLSPGEHGGSQYILSPGHESEEEEEEYDGEDTLMPLRRDEGKNFLAALKEEGDKMMMKVDNVQNKHDASETTTNTTATTLLGKKQKRMAVLNRKPSIEVDSSGTMVTNFNNIANKSRVMFPIFSKGQKTVHLVRHGQSTYNEAISGPGSWEEPKIFDARLTELGIEQAKKLGKFLSKLPKDAVWITSPLTRAMQTCVYGRESMYAFVEEQQQQQHLGKSSPDENAAPANNNNHNNNSNYNDSNRKSSLRRKAKKNETTTTDFKEVDNEAHFNNNNDSNTTTHKEWGRNVVIRPEITEKLSCSGDIGRPKGELISDMPLFEHSLSKLPDDTWWWETEEKRNDATEQIFNSNEPTRVFQRRVDKFRQWILSHPSNTFVVFGHSTFFKEMIGRSLKNCEVASLQL